MDNLLTSLSETINIINDNFWTIMVILILIFLISKENRIAGILLIAMNIVCGFKIWIFALILFTSLCTFYLNPKRYYEREYEKKVRELERKQNKIKNINEY